MKISKLFLPLAICLIACPALTDTIIPPGPVSGHWTFTGSPYLIEGEIIISPSTSLLIDPGVEVIFQRHYKFIIQGILTAVGIETDSITFTAADTSRGWHGLRFYYLSTQPDSSRLVYCRITYGRSSSDNNTWEDKHGGAIFCSNSDKLLISNCLICNNRTGSIVGAPGSPGTGQWIPGGPGESVTSGHGGAIFISHSSPSITYNTIYYNQTGDATGGQGGHGYNHTSWYGSTHGSNGGNGGDGTSGNGGAIYCTSCSPLLNGNIIFENATGTGTGGQGGEGGFAHTLEGSMPPSPTASGGDGGNGGFAEAGVGGAICLRFFDGYLKNNLIYSNCTGGAAGGDGGDGGEAIFEYGVYGFGGDGGDGGNGRGGNGGCIHLETSSPPLNNNTINSNIYGRGIPGNGGAAGYGNLSMGWPGSPGSGSNGIGVINNASVSFVPETSNSIIWDNGMRPIIGDFQISYSCVQEGYPGIGNINVDPLFTSNPIGEYFLSQIAAGQPVQSACVDAGCPDSIMITGTTRADGVQDTDIIDMGYHYPNFTMQPAIAVSPDTLIFEAAISGPNPENQIFQIINIWTGSFNYRISENIDWLTVTPTSGGPIPPTAEVTVSVDATGLSYGTYEGDIIVTAPGAFGSPKTVHVVLIVGNATLSVSTDSVLFYAAVGGSNPPPQTFQVDNIGVGLFRYDISENANWLTVTPMSGGPVPPAFTETVSVDISGLITGTYTTDIIISAPVWVLYNPSTVNVLLKVIYNPIAGPLSGVLTADTYTVIGDIAILNGDSLTIEAGTTLLFSGMFGFNIYGFVNAAGTESDSIKFMPDTLVSGWKGIVFYDTALDSNILNYCLITGSDSSGITCIDSDPAILNCTINQNSGEYGGGIRCKEDSGPLISHCNITGNTALEYGGGIYFNSSHICMEYCLIENNFAEHRGGGVGCGSCVSITIDNCTIIGNSTNSYGGGGVYLHHSSYSNNAMISDCDIIGNSSDNCGGGIFCVGPNTYIVNSVISENTAGNKGGGIYNNAVLNLENCIIQGNSAVYHGGGIYNHEYYGLTANHSVLSNNVAGYYGGGIYVGDVSSITTNNCTIGRNSAGYQGGGIYFFDGPYIADIVNTIIEGNTGWGGISGEYSNANIIYGNYFNNAGGNFTGECPPGLGNIVTTNANGDSCDIFYNIFMDPLFYSTTGDSAFYLTENSPCIDAGDPQSPLDPDSTTADMGAFYFDQSIPGIKEKPNRIIPKEFCFSPNYPNPFNPQTTIRFGLPTASMVSLKIYDISGRSVATIADRWFAAGYHQATFEGASLASGIYIARITAGDFVQTQKMVLIK